MNTNVKTELAAVAATQSAVDAMAVVTLSPEKYAAEVYQPFNARLSAAIDSVRAIDYDIKTTAGMAVAVKARATFRDLRTEADNERKERKAPITKIGKLLESHFDMVEERSRPLEALFDGDIQAEIERKEVEKAAKIAAERARTEAIEKAIQAIRDIPLMAVGKSSEDISALIGGLVSREPDESFEEFIEQAKVARHEALDKLAAAETAQRAIEIEAESQRQEAARVALAAEEARKAEAKRAADEAAAVAAQRAENERVANELAISAKRLADQEAAQALVAKQLADKAAANLRAENEARDTQVRLQREAQEKNRMALSQIEAIRHQAVIAEVGRSPYVKGGDAASYLFVLAETRARVIDDEQFGVMTASAQMVKDSTIVMLEQGPALYMAVDHAEALLEDAQFDADREAQREQEHHDSIFRLQAAADQHLTDNLPPPESCCARDARIDSGEEDGPSDEDIIEFGKEWDLDLVELVECLEAFTARARAAGLVMA